MAPPAAPITSLYLHVPFCARKCSYCAFYSEASGAELIQRYTQALVRELEMVGADLAPATVFFGGGTPSLLNLAQWEIILHAFDRLGLLGALEWTIECNPSTVSLDKARLWREFGVNRVSMGVQSTNESLLDRLGRVHSRAAVFQSYDLLRRAGFSNINLDLMFAIPGQTLAVWEESLGEIIQLGPEHLSCYEVIYEEDTPLFDDLEAGRVTLNEDLACAMYEELLAHAAQAGYRQYEIANFARDDSSVGALPDLPSRACRHNVNYWRGGSYYGLGPSAAGYVRGVRTQNLSNTPLYCDALERGRRPAAADEALTPLRRAGELAAFGLRMNAGWPYAAFAEATGFDLRQEWKSEMHALASRGWGAIETDRFHLTQEGLRFADAAGAEFLR
jgi:oxygen-independent coproporphyrinogen-3 oxidase